MKLGVQNLGLCSAEIAFVQGGIFIVPYLLCFHLHDLVRRVTPFTGRQLLHCDI